LRFRCPSSIPALWREQRTFVIFSLCVIWLSSLICSAAVQPGRVRRGSELQPVPGRQDLGLCRCVRCFSLFQCSVFWSASSAFGWLIFAELSHRGFMLRVCCVLDARWSAPSLALKFDFERAFCPDVQVRRRAWTARPATSLPPEAAPSATSGESLPHVNSQPFVDWLFLPLLLASFACRCVPPA
jgi:hypothetical protein